MHHPNLPRFPWTTRSNAAPGWPARRRWPVGARIRALIGLPLLLIGPGAAALIGWVSAGGDLSTVLVPLPFISPAVMDDPPDAGPVHVDSTPAGTEVRVDGVRRGRTPLTIVLVPGQHALSLRHPEALDTDQLLDVPAESAELSVPLWRRRPDVLPLRPVAPGAGILDVRWLGDGELAPLVGVPGQGGATERTQTRELWRLDPVTGRRQRLGVPGAADLSAPSLAVAPDGQQIAYVSPGSGGSRATSLWRTGPTGATRAPGPGSDMDSAWVAPLDGGGPPQPVFELPPANAGSATAERVVDLLWTPDSTRLVAITRIDSAPARARVFLIQVAPTGSPTELVLLPAEVVRASASPDPTGAGSPCSHVRRPRPA